MAGVDVSRAEQAAEARPRRVSSAELKEFHRRQGASTASEGSENSVIWLSVADSGSRVEETGDQRLEGTEHPWEALKCPDWEVMRQRGQEGRTETGDTTLGRQTRFHLLCPLFLTTDQVPVLFEVAMCPAPR